MHRKNIVSALFFIALPWVTQPVCLASTPRLAATRAPKAQLEQRRPGLRKKVSRSPFDRIFAPGFETVNRHPLGARKVRSPIA